MEAILAGLSSTPANRTKGLLIPMKGVTINNFKLGTKI